MNPMLETAIKFHTAGFSVIRAATDGTKKPVGTWEKYMNIQPTLEDVVTWFKDGHQGIGVVTGFNNLECLEVEGRAVASKLHITAREIAFESDMKELWERINSGYVEQSPSGGIHWLYRILDPPEIFPGNIKIASRPGENQNSEVLVETRGKGGFIITAPSHGSTHPSGKPWEMVAGDVMSIPTITWDERNALHGIFRTLDEMPTKEGIAQSLSTDAKDMDKPWNDFNARASWSEILLGWKVVYSSQGITFWRRPGKDQGVSATTGKNDGDNLYIFTTSTTFESEKPYSKFSAFAHLYHGGDISSATKDLRSKGYGSASIAPTNELKPLATNLEPILKDVSIDGIEDESSWKPVDLKPYFDGSHVQSKATLFLRSDGKGLLYPGKLHSFYGESESGKSWVAQMVVAEQLKMFRKVIYIDFESDAMDLIHRLQLLQVTQAEILQNFIYIKPDTARDHDDPHWQQILEKDAATLVVIDGVTEALTMWGGESKDNDSITRWMRIFPRKIAESSGACVLTIDHVTKDKESRGRFAIGGQAKLAVIDGAAFLIEPLELLAPGRVGSLSIRKTKDRPGAVAEVCGMWRKSDRTQEAAVITMDSSRESHIVLVIAPPLMEEEVLSIRHEKMDAAIATYIHSNAGASKRMVIAGVTGDDKAIAIRIDELVLEGIIQNQGSSKGYSLHVSDAGKRKFNLLDATVLQLGSAN